jgi:3-deoxy-7-phosphoheptulonate synthase
MHPTSDLRVDAIRPLISPAILLEEIPITEAAAETVERSRAEVADILAGRDDRLIAVVGPCSIHDPAAAVDYGRQLAEVAESIAKDVLVVMRVYFEKPRTTVGWKGLINDPNLDGSFQINQGLRTARGLLRELCDLGLPCGCEFLDPISPQFICDLVSWGAIGARTTESQVHRELVSGLSMPVGFKNGTGGSTQLAMDAMLSSSHPHRFMGITTQGLAAIVSTRGNPDCHLILRGGSRGPNYDADHISGLAMAMAEKGLRANVMVDCSHGNSQKDHRNQPVVAEAVAKQVADGQSAIIGVMLESFLVAGRQTVDESLTYGQSITDACMDLQMTTGALQQLAQAVRRRRQG